MIASLAVPSPVRVLWAAPPRTVAQLVFDLGTAVDVTGQGGHVYLKSGAADVHVSHAELSRRATCAGARLLALGLQPRDAVALIVVDPQSFIELFLGALRVGLVPVPLYPPLGLGKLDAYLETTAALVRAAEARVVVVAGAMLPLVWTLRDRAPDIVGIYDADKLPDGDVDAVPGPDVVGPEDTAFLQFTSGSTSAPKGVRVTHGGLMANSYAIMVDSLRAGPEDRCLSWLPLYHDMGLIGFVVAPLVTRSQALFLPTVEFIKKPALWLESLSRLRATITFAPNFAYALAQKKVPTTTFDLSSVRVFGCGAEPIHAQTLERFLTTFAPQGLKRTALLPCYGMAEATLAMTFIGLDEEMSSDVIDREQYQRRKKAVAADGDDTATFVCCGRAPPGHSVFVVDDQGRRLPDRSVGEIVFHGPSVAGGYFKNPEATARAFTPQGLLTGDLGYVVDGALFVTGRKKDLLIIHGRNIDPQAIEQAAGLVDGVRKGNAVAFARPGQGTEEAVLVFETQTAKHLQPALIAAIKKRVRADVGVVLSDVVALAPGQLPKTSSGKHQRQKARGQYLEGRLGQEGLRTVGGKVQTLVLARHLWRGTRSRFIHAMRARWASIRSH